MKNMTIEESEELRQELLEEQWRSEVEEHLMRDLDYALTTYSDRIEEAYTLLTHVSKDLSEYGHELNPLEILDMI